jgi:hypothetical protein
MKIFRSTFQIIQDLINSRILLFFFLFFLLYPAVGNYGNPAGDAKPLFSGENPLEITLIFPFDSVLHDIGDDPRDWKGQMILPGFKAPFNIEFEVRGSFRKNPRYCNFPPLKLEFDREKMHSTVFAKLDKIKLVTHCQTYDEAYEQYLYQEYLIYRMYNVFTDVSYRVRLVDITYKDLNNPAITITKPGFFLEDPDDIADRFDGQELEVKNVARYEVNKQHYEMLSVFQYMIMNKDWSVPLLHNIKLIATNPYNGPLPVPYDFDWAGIINIPYQVPSATYNPNVGPERKYLGICSKKKDLMGTFNIFNDKKDKLYQLILHSEVLNFEIKQKMTAELDAFFMVINSNSLIRKEFIKPCKKRMRRIKRNAIR